MIVALSGREYELIKITLKVLGKFSKFDVIKIYNDEKGFSVCTINRQENFVTRTLIGKTTWKVKESFYKKAGEEEVKLK